jgi:hypothetical protein
MVLFHPTLLDHANTRFAVPLADEKLLFETGLGMALWSPLPGNPPVLACQRSAGGHVNSFFFVASWLSVNQTVQH